MKALLLSIGTRGDMEPFLAMAQMLRKNGWEVVCGMPEQFKETLAQHQIPFYPFDRRFLELIEGKDGRAVMGQQGSRWFRIKAMLRIIKASKQVQKTILKEQHDVIQQENPDLVLYHSKCLFPLVWGMANPNKSIMMSPMPCVAHPVKHQPMVGVKVNLGSNFNLFTYWAVGWIRGFVTKMLTKDLRKDLKNTKFTARRIKRFMLNQETAFYSFSPSLFTKPDYWADHIHITGFRELDKKTAYEPDAQLEAFLTKHDKILFISFGSMINAKPEKVTKAFCEICTRHNIPVIINTSWGGLVEQEVASDLIHFVRNIPYDWLFPKIHAVVHHGGSGTTHTALKYGCANLIIPHIVDQFFWNNTVANLGAGPKGIPIKKADLERLEPKIQELWLNPSYKQKAEAISFQMSKEDFEDQILALVQGN